MTVLTSGGGAQASLWPSVAPFLRQLVSLTIHPQQENAGQWWARTIFTPAYTTTTLKRLSLSDGLCPDLCQMLQEHTPVCIPIATHTVRDEYSCRLCRMYC